MRLATCNEPWRETPIEEVFKIAARIGFEGVELATFTIAEHVDQISADRRKAIVRAGADAGVSIVGLHWLLAKTTGFHLTSPDAEVRERTANYLAALVDFCADLGGKVMVVDSPKQRNILPDVMAEQAWTRHMEPLMKLPEDLPARLGVLVQYGHADSCAGSFNR